MFAHIVFFTPKPELSSEQKRAFARIFQASIETIPSIRRAVVGRAITMTAMYGDRMGLKTYEYAAVVEFDDHQGLLEYLNHDDHRELGRLFWENCAETAIADCELKEIADGLDGLFG